MKKRILCFGDSNTWGYNAKDGSRYDESIRWTCLLENQLGNGYKVIEEGQNGRTFIVDDFELGYMSGKYYLQPCLKSHDPIDLFIIMLGTNDLKKSYNLSISEIAEGLYEVLYIANEYWDKCARKKPVVLVVSPPHIGEKLKSSQFAEDFIVEDAIIKSKELGKHLKTKAESFGFSFLDAAKYVTANNIDGLHLDYQGHKVLADLIYEWIRENL